MNMIKDAIPFSLNYYFGDGLIGIVKLMSTNKKTLTQLKGCDIWHRFAYYPLFKKTMMDFRTSDMIIK